MMDRHQSSFYIKFGVPRYSDVRMGAMTSQITSFTTAYSIVQFIEAQLKETSKARVTSLCVGN